MPSNKRSSRGGSSATNPILVSRAAADAFEIVPSENPGNITIHRLAALPKAALGTVARAYNHPAGTLFTQIESPDAIFSFHTLVPGNNYRIELRYGSLRVVQSPFRSFGVHQAEPE